jgi:hypothetical protein
MPDARRCFDIQITRDGPWWMIHIPEIDGLTPGPPPRRNRVDGA